MKLIYQVSKKLSPKYQSQTKSKSDSNLKLKNQIYQLANMIYQNQSKLAKNSNIYKQHQNWINLSFLFANQAMLLDTKEMQKIIPKKTNSYSREMLWCDHREKPFSLIGFNFNNSLLLHLYDTNLNPNHKFYKDLNNTQDPDIIRTPIHNHSCYSCSILLKGELQENMFYDDKIDNIHRKEGSVTIGFPFLTTHQVIKYNNLNKTNQNQNQNQNKQE